MSKPIEITDANFQSEVLQSEQLVLVDFWAAWCGPCRRVGPMIDELATQYEGTVRVGKLDVDQNPDAVSAYGIHSIPAVLLFKDGQVVDQIVGAQSKEHYEEAVQNLAA